MSAPSALSLALAATATAAAPPAHYRFDELHAAPLTFAERLLGRPAPEMVEAQAVNFPGVAQYSSVSLFFAPHARATGWGDLCRLDMQSVAFSFVEPRDAAGTLIPSAPERVTVYALTGARPPLAPAARAAEAGEAACRGLTPFLNRRHWRLTHIAFNGQEAAPAQAVFAYRAAAAAGSAEHFTMDPCDGAETHCVAGLAYLRTLDLRDFYQLDVAPCRAGETTLCVTGFLENDQGTGSIRIRIETDADGVVPEQPVHARSVTIGAGLYPVA